MADQQNDATPWLAREQWARGRVPSSQTAGLVLPWIMAAGFCGVTSAYLAGYGLFRDPGKVFEDPSFLALAPFVVVSVGLLLWVVRRTWIAAVSAASVLELSTIPGVIGGELTGLIRLPRELREGQGIRLILTCTVIPWIHTGTKSYCSPYTPWQDDREIAASEITGRGNVVPVHFTIPANSKATVDHHNDGGSDWHSVVWTLEALGEPGTFWRGEYEVPVFRTRQSPPLAPPEQHSIAEVAFAAGAMLHGTAFNEKKPELVARPASTRIITRFTSNGLEIKLPIRLVFLIASLWVLVTLPLYVAPVIVARWFPNFAFLSTTVWLWAAFFLNVLPGFFLVIGEPRRIIVGQREIVTPCGWPPFGLTRRFPLEQFDGIEASTQYFGVLRKNASLLKRRFLLATTLESSAEARWLASVIDGAIRHHTT
ncbi:MAG TPA: hypothetical protein VF505_05930 [Thermoanaerobaculia bacterium]